MFDDEKLQPPTGTENDTDRLLRLDPAYFPESIDCLTAQPPLTTSTTDPPAPERLECDSNSSRERSSPSVHRLDPLRESQESMHRLVAGTLRRSPRRTTVDVLQHIGIPHLKFVSPRLLSPGVYLLCG